MYDCQERGGWVEHEWEVPDLDLIEVSLEKLCGWTGSIFDAVWTHMLQASVNEIRHGREVQKQQLMRYGRWGAGRLSRMPVPEIRARLRILEEVLAMENEASRVTEND